MPCSDPEGDIEYEGHGALVAFGELEPDLDAESIGVVEDLIVRTNHAVGVRREFVGRRRVWDLLHADRDSHDGVAPCVGYRDDTPTLSADSKTRVSASTSIGRSASSTAVKRVSRFGGRLRDLFVRQRGVGDPGGVVGDERDAGHPDPHVVERNGLGNRRHADEVATGPSHHLDLGRRLVARSEEPGVDTLAIGHRRQLRTLAS